MKASNMLTWGNHQYAGIRGISENNRHQGFVTAFLDIYTGYIYRSRLPDEQPAPVHILCDLPQEILDEVVSVFYLKKHFIPENKQQSL